MTGLHDFGGSGPILHLAHANGFPPGSYTPLAKTLVDRYRVMGLKFWPVRSGGEPEFAPSWRPLAEKLIAGLEGLGLTGVAGVGHSLGGVLTLWAAVRRPDLFRGVVLIDPVILPPGSLLRMRLARYFGLQWRQSLVHGALNRRETWPSRQACFDHLRRKPLFAGWSDTAVWAYVEAGTRPGTGGGVELVYPRSWEAHIFATPPTDVWRDVPKLRIPTLVIRGERSETFQRSALRRMARLLPQARFVTVSGAGHLVPMERPAETGAAIHEFLGSLDFEAVTQTPQTPGASKTPGVRLDLGLDLDRIAVRRYNGFREGKDVTGDNDADAG